jgi:caa(3)-type oxidase subunit IV
MSAPAPHASHGPGTLVAVWAALVALTGTLVAANHFAPGNPGIVAVAILTPAKAGLVLWHFMDLRQEGRAIRYMLAAAVATIAVFIALLMVDYSFR